jgi:hypothetical protein
LHREVLRPPSSTFPSVATLVRSIIVIPAILANPITLLHLLGAAPLVVALDTPCKIVITAFGTEPISVLKFLSRLHTITFAIKLHKHLRDVFLQS